MFESFISSMGFTQSAGQIFILFLVNVFATIIVVGLFHKLEYNIEIAIATFFGLLIIEVFQGWMPWIALVLPLLIVLIAWIPLKKSEGGSNG